MYYYVFRHRRIWIASRSRRACTEMRGFGGVVDRLSIPLDRIAPFHLSVDGPTSSFFALPVRFKLCVSFGARPGSQGCGYSCAHGGATLTRNMPYRLFVFAASPYEGCGVAGLEISQSAVSASRALLFRKRLHGARFDVFVYRCASHG